MSTSALLMFALLIWPLFLFAQELDVIVVTETRRPQPLQNISASISRLNADEIEQVRAEHISELLSRVPGVLIHRGNGQEHLTAIRSPVLTGSAGAGSFLFLENGVPLRAKGFANVNALFEAHTELAEAIEVVRGPGGVVHGTNAVHGVINILSPLPARINASGGAISAGSFGRLKSDVWSSLRGDHHAFYVGFSDINESGFRDDSGLDQQKLTLRHFYDVDDIQITTSLTGHDLDQETAGYIVGVDAYKDSDIRRRNPNPEAFRNAKALRISSRIEIKGEEREFVITPYARWNEMNFLLHFFPSKALEENGHKSMGVQAALYQQLSSSASLTVGLDAEKTEGFLTETQSINSFGSFPQGIHYDYEVAEHNLSGYLQYQHDFARQWTFDSGLRIESTQYNYTNKTISNIIGRFNRPADRVDKFTTVSAKAGVNYKMSPDVKWYLAYKRGERAPQTVELYQLQINQSVDEIAPETMDSIEMGLRRRFESGAVEVTAYYMDKRHFFFRNADGFNISNGRTRHVGAEIHATFDLTPTLSMSSNAAYGNHTYRFTDVVASPSDIIVSGNAVDTAPRWIAGARLIWTLSDSIFGEVEWTYVDKYFTDAANENSYPGHSLFNARFIWKATEAVELFCAIRNISNSLYAERADSAFGRDRFFPGEERALSGGMRVQF